MFSLTLTSRVSERAATYGSDLRFFQGGWEIGLAGLVGLGALILPHVPGLEEGWGRTPTNSNMKAILKNTGLVRNPILQSWEQVKITHSSVGALYACQLGLKGKKVL